MLGINWYNADLLNMLVFFAINMFFITIIVRGLYYRYAGKTEYVFTYFMVSIVIFFLCFTLKRFSLDIGMALGLFAIFGIIRYRTRTVDIKEMTYLFIVIGVSVINALVNDSLSWVEILGTNIVIVGANFAIEKYILAHGRIEQRKIVYEDLENIKPENYERLLEDLRSKTGLEIHHINIGKVDYAAKMANLTISYHTER